MSATSSIGWRRWQGSIVPVAQYNFIKAHFSKTVKQEHDSWIMKERAKAEKAGTPYVAKDIDDLHAWLEQPARMAGDNVTNTNLHTLIEWVESRGYVNLLLYQNVGLLDHVDQVASGLSVRENVFLHMVTPPVAPEPEPIPVAPVLPAVPAVNIDNLTAEFSKMALHVTSGKALDMYQLSHAQSEEFKALCLVFRGPAVVSSPASSNISKGVVTVTNDRGFERRKFDITKSKSLSDLRDLETGEMWRMKYGKLIYKLLKEKVEAGSVSMMHKEGEEASNTQMPSCAAEYPQPSTAKATPILMARLPKLANYPKIHLPATCPDPVLPKTVPPVPKPSAKYQYKKSNEMASVDLDKRTVEILMTTKIELTAMDLIAFSPFFRKKVNDIPRTHRMAVNKVIEAIDPVPDASATVGFLQSRLPTSIGSFAEDGSAENCLLMSKLFREGGSESTMPKAVVDLLRYNVVHVANIVSCKAASEECTVYWNLEDRPAGTKYNVYRTSTAFEWDPSTQYSTHGSPYVRSVVSQEMFEVDQVLLDMGAEMNVCSWAVADDAKAGSCVDRDVLMTMFNVASGSSRMFGMLRGCLINSPRNALELGILRKKADNNHLEELSNAAVVFGQEDKLGQSLYAHVFAAPFMEEHQFAQKFHVFVSTYETASTMDKARNGVSIWMDRELFMSCSLGKPDMGEPLLHRLEHHKRWKNISGGSLWMPGLHQCLLSIQESGKARKRTIQVSALAIHVMCLKKDELSVLMGGNFNVAAEAMDIHPRVIPLISSGFHDAERVLLRALLRYLHDFWREEYPDACDFTTWFYLDQRRNEGMRYNMILGSEQIALSICHTHGFTVSDHIPVVLHTHLNHLHADFLHLMYEEGSTFGDDESDAISESGFHACLRCGTSDSSKGSTKCLRCMEAVSGGFSGFGSEEDGLKSLNLGGSVQGLFDDEFLAIR
ncbi:hypothetical protein HDU77_001473 [Chytriomyces hyalinus]|nr:hypothetical protein HDU77_001473 [Chytriomyces hyalinus]